jgi:hypothetical protein
MDPVDSAYEVPIELPLVDWEVGAPLVPSMEQSQALATDGYRLLGLGLREGTQAVIRNEPAAIGVGLGLDYAAAFLLTPLEILAHEEWHLAALRQGGVTGTDRFLQGEVVDVSDQELIDFKTADPAGLVRAHSAGIEQQIAFTRRLADDQFAYAGESWHVGPFEGGHTFAAPYAQALEVNTFAYLGFCASAEGTADAIADAEARETDELERDFTGPDCTAWARDLFRPDEPYEARGAHPSGEGIGRYVAFGDLTPEEQRFLKAQVPLHALSLVNPQLYGIDRVRVGRGYGTASLTHWLTPYGYAVDLHGGYRESGATAFGTVRLGVSDGRVFPSVGAELRDVHLRGDLWLDGEATAWLQPDALRWGGDPRPGGALSARVRWRAAERAAPFVGVVAKSSGWEPGIAALDPALYLTAGATLGVGRPRALPQPRDRSR